MRPSSSLSERQCYSELQGFEPRPSSTICPEKSSERIREYPGTCGVCARLVPEHDSVRLAPALIATVGGLISVSRYADASSCMPYTPDTMRQRRPASHAASIGESPRCL